MPLEEGYLFLECDVMKESQVRGAIEQTMANFGRIDVALACAGIGPRFLTIDANGNGFDCDSFEKVMAINLLGSAYVAKYAAVAMVANAPKSDEVDTRDRGLILFVGSVAGDEG